MKTLDFSQQKSRQPAQRGRRRSSRQRAEPALRPLLRNSTCPARPSTPIPTRTTSTAISRILTPPGSRMCRLSTSITTRPTTRCSPWSGDVKTDEIFEKVEKYFGAIPASAKCHPSPMSPRSRRPPNGAYRGRQAGHAARARHRLPHAAENTARTPWSRQSPESYCTTARPRGSTNISLKKSRSPPKSRAE